MILRIFPAGGTKKMCQILSDMHAYSKMKTKL